MPYREDPSRLYSQGNGTYKDADGNIYNAQGYRIAESQKTIHTRQQAQAYTQQQRQQEQQMWRNAWNKTGGLPNYLSKPFRGLGSSLGGFMKLFFGLLIFFAVLLVVLPLILSLFGVITNVFKTIGHLMGTFFLSWPRTFPYIGRALGHWNLFKHFGTYWPYLPELLLGVFIPVKYVQTIKKVEDDDVFRTEDLLKCALPFLAIEVLHFFTHNGHVEAITFLEALFRGAGLGVGISLIVAIVKKITYKLLQ